MDRIICTQYKNAMIILVTSILTAYNKKRCSPLVQALSERTKNRDYFRKQAVHKSAPYPLSGSLLQLFLQLTHSSDEVTALKQISGDCSLSDLFTH